MRFTDAYAACTVCSPTRASILTGKYPARLHLTDWLPGRMDRPRPKAPRPRRSSAISRSDEVTIADAFKDAGYATAFIGKWHLGGNEFYPRAPRLRPQHRRLRQRPSALLLLPLQHPHAPRWPQRRIPDRPPDR